MLLRPHLRLARPFVQVKAEREASAKQGSGTGPMQSNGFDFTTLVNRVPHLEQELMTFRDHLLASASQEQTLKVRLEPSLS